MCTPRSAATALSLVAALTLAACGGADDGVGRAAPAAVDTAGSRPAPDPADTSAAASATLRIAVTPGWEDYIAPLIAPGASAAGDRSIVELDREWTVAHDGVDIEQEIVRAVAAGELDLGYVGTRALADAGAPGFAALTAPFVIDSYALQEAVLTSELPAELLAGADAVGVVGLALVAGPLRRPMGVEAPIVALEDFEGRTFHTFRSTTNAMTAEALGATHTDVYNQERDDGLLDGAIDGTENTLAWALNNPIAPYLTAGVAFWPATGVLIARPGALDALADADREWLLTVAGTGLPTAADYAEAEAELIEPLCDRGSRFAPATDDELDGLRRAVGGVRDAIDDEPVAASALERIDDLRAGVTAEQAVIPDGCEGAVPDVESEVAVGADDPSVLDGAFVVEWTADELMAALVEVGVDDPALARENAGVITLTFDAGGFDQFFVTDVGAESNCPGTYAISGDRLVMIASSDLAEWECGGDSLGMVIVDARWELVDGALALSDFQLSEEPDITWFNALFYGKPLTARP